ncbi:MAG: cation transporter [Eubacterium sp.]|nr:cation transporter [Eubacterium sp.]
MTADSKKKLSVESKVMRCSFIGSAAILAAEIISWLIIRSNAVLMDCIFDSMDLILVGPFLILVPFLYRKESEKHPYGYGQYESLFIIVKYTILIGICISQIRENILVIQEGGHTVKASEVISFELGVLVFCLILYLILKAYSRRYCSDIIRDELYAWRFDIISSIGIAAAFFLEFPLKHSSLAFLVPYLDPVIAIVMTCVLLVEPCCEIYRNVRELLLFAAPKDQADGIRKIAEEELSHFGCHVTFLETVQTGRKTWIEVYFKSQSELLHVNHMKLITENIQKRLDGKFDQYYVEIIPDLDQARAKRIGNTGKALQSDMRSAIDAGAAADIDA